jgi:hypothetical protein
VWSVKTYLSLIAVVPTRQRKPDALERSGDEGPLACEIEQFKCHVGLCA